MENIVVVMTSENNDPEEWCQFVSNNHYETELAKKIKDNDSPLKTAIVVDMWPTGFDVLSLFAMYVYNLWQVIT